VNRVAAVPLVIRAVTVLAGLVLVVVPGSFRPVPVVITLGGVAAAAIAPRTMGSGLATAGAVLAWVTASGWSVSLPVERTVIAAAALYVLQVSTALAAAVPLDARVDGTVLAAWVRRLVWPAVAAAVLIALDEVLPQQSGSPWIEVGGLVGVLALAAAAAYAVRRRSAP
jgi:MYXO-CTERM domain-containing protein